MWYEETRIKKLKAIVVKSVPHIFCSMDCRSSTNRTLSAQEQISGYQESCSDLQIGRSGESSTAFGQLSSWLSVHNTKTNPTFSIAMCWCVLLGIGRSDAWSPRVANALCPCVRVERESAGGEQSSLRVLWLQVMAVNFCLSWGHYEFLFS